MNTSAVSAIDSGTTRGTVSYCSTLSLGVLALLCSAIPPGDWPIEYVRDQYPASAIGGAFRPTENQTSQAFQAPPIDDQLAIALRDTFHTLSSTQTELDPDIAEALNARRWDLYA